MGLSAESAIKDYKITVRALVKSAHSETEPTAPNSYCGFTYRYILLREQCCLTCTKIGVTPGLRPTKRFSHSGEKRLLASPCLPFGPRGKSRAPRDGFSRNSILEVFLSKSSRENTYFIKICKGDYLRPMYIYVNISFNSSSNEKWSDKSCTQNRDTVYVIYPFFSENCAVYESMREN